MKILITFDYEIYFGAETGTAERCILGPTKSLLEIGRRHGVSFVFFVDCGYLLRLRSFRKYPAMEREYEQITAQLKELSAAGHDLQLHIHPHWEDTSYDGTRWRMNVSRYKLADFSDTEIHEIVNRYAGVIRDLTGRPATAYRAGGWCLQPFSRIGPALKAHGISMDSSVFRNGHYSSAQYDYDFRGAPDKSTYRFNEDPVLEDPEGHFSEYPITPIRNSPLFFWRLFLLGRMNPWLHKPLGDGRAMAAPGQRLKLLTRFTRQGLSVDGYNARLLPAALRRAERRNLDHLVVIGHPKALSRYSLVRLDAFIKKARAGHKFVTFTMLQDSP